MRRVPGFLRLAAGFAFRLLHDRHAVGGDRPARSQVLHRYIDSGVGRAEVADKDAVLGPFEARLVGRGRAQVWAESSDTVASLIYGPHLEDLARSWCVDQASTETLGGLPSRCEPALVACREHKTSYELDVVVTADTPLTGARILAIGEVKATRSPVGLSQLQRLEHIRTLLPPAMSPAPPRLLLFARGIHRCGDRPRRPRAHRAEPPLRRLLTACVAGGPGRRRGAPGADRPEIKKSNSRCRTDRSAPHTSCSAWPPGGHGATAAMARDPRVCGRRESRPGPDEGDAHARRDRAGKAPLGTRLTGPR